MQKPVSPGSGCREEVSVAPFTVATSSGYDARDDGDVGGSPGGDPPPGGALSGVLDPSDGKRETAAAEGVPPSKRPSIRPGYDAGMPASSSGWRTMESLRHLLRLVMGAVKCQPIW